MFHIYTGVLRMQDVLFHFKSYYSDKRKKREAGEDCHDHMPNIPINK